MQLQLLTPGYRGSRYFRRIQLTSAKTARKHLPAIYKLVQKHYGWTPLTINLDLGGGPYEVFTDKLTGVGVVNFVHDPYNRDSYHNMHIAECFFNSNNVDTVTVSNVLNVIPTWPEKYALINVAIRAVRPGGRIYITVYERNRSGNGEWTRDGWQDNMQTCEYFDWLTNKPGGWPPQCSLVRWRRHGKLIVGAKRGKKWNQQNVFSTGRYLNSNAA